MTQIAPERLLSGSESARISLSIQIRRRATAGLRVRCSLRRHFLPGVAGTPQQGRVKPPFTAFHALRRQHAPRYLAACFAAVIEAHTTARSADLAARGIGPSMALQTSPAADRRPGPLRLAAGGLLIGALALGLAACSRGDSRPKADLAAAQVTSIGVNSYLWRASLETLSFMPLTQADSSGGVIVTDWYANP